MGQYTFNQKVIEMLKTRSIQAWAVSGELSDSSGGFQESSPHRWAMLADSLPTPPTKKSAQVTYSPTCLVFKHQTLISMY